MFLQKILLPGYSILEQIQNSHSLSVLMYRISMYHWPTNGGSLHWRLKILPCKTERNAVHFNFSDYFLSLSISFLSLFLIFFFVFASLSHLYDPPERSMFPLRDTRVTTFSLGWHSTIKGDKEGEVSRG